MRCEHGSKNEGSEPDDGSGVDFSQQNTTSRVIFESNSRRSHSAGWRAKDLKSSTSETVHTGESGAKAANHGL